MLTGVGPVRPSTVHFSLVTFLPACTAVTSENGAKSRILWLISMNAGHPGVAV